VFSFSKLLTAQKQRLNSNDFVFVNRRISFLLTGVNFIAMAAITAATIALELAAGKIDADIEEMTKTYLEDLKRSKMAVFVSRIYWNQTLFLTNLHESLIIGFSVLWNENFADFPLYQLEIVKWSNIRSKF
jgi:hypothetical protein